METALAALFILPARATDANGDTYAGALAHFYVPDTVTPQAIYTTGDLDVEHTNPVEADAGGLFPNIYLDPLLNYRAVVTNSTGSVTIFDGDPRSSNSTDTLVVQADSAAAFEVQQADGTVVAKIGTLDAYTGTGTATEGAPRTFWGTRTSSNDDSCILIGRNLVGASLFSHAVRDESFFTSTSDSAYTSFDAAYTVTGTGNKNHFHCFQSRPIYDCTGTVGRLAGSTSEPTVIDGTVTFLTHFYVENATITAPAVVTEQYGLYVRPLSGAGSNFGVYVAGANPSYFGGTVQIGGDVSLTGASAKLRVGTFTYGTELEITGNASVTGFYAVDGVQVVSNRGAAVADAVNAAGAPTQAEFNALVTQVNALLARLRTHGLIAT